MYLVKDEALMHRSELKGLPATKVTGQTADLDRFLGPMGRRSSCIGPRTQ